VSLPTATRALLRSARLPGLLHVTCAAVLAGGLWSLPGAAGAAAIVNTAAVTFTGPGGGATTRNSNTTTLATLPAPTPGVVTLYQYAPASSTATIPFDGGLSGTCGSAITDCP